MKTEISFYDKDISDEKLLDGLSTAIKYDCDIICVLPTKIDLIKPHVSECAKDIKIAGAINFPTGNSFTTVRMHEIISCCKHGVHIIDLTINMSYVRNESWDLLEKDLIACLNVCNDHNVPLRAIIEYRMLDDKTILNLVRLLQKNNIEYLINATGTMSDDTCDNVIICKFLLDNSTLNVIANGRIFTEQHRRMFEGLGLWGIRLQNANILKNVYSM